jgi:hypothetical protein
MSTETNENLEPQNDQAENQVENQVENQESAQDQPWYATYGFENEDSLKSGVEELLSYKSRLSEIEVKEKEIQEGLSLLQDAEDPYAGIDEAKTMVAFGKKGLTPSIAKDLMSIDAEKVMEDPLQALVIHEAIKNPSKFKQLGKETIEEALREKYNIGAGDYYATALMKSDAIDAIESIQNFKKEVENVKNPYTFAKELKSQAEKTYAERQSLAIGEVQSYAKTIKEVPYKFGDNEVSLKVSNEELDAILNSQVVSFLGRAFDPNTKEGKQGLRDWMVKEILTHKVQSGDFGVQIAKSLSAGAEKKAVRDVYNGQPKTVNRVSKTDIDAKNLTPAQRDLLERGLPLPSQQLKKVE